MKPAPPAARERVVLVVGLLLLALFGTYVRIAAGATPAIVGAVGLQGSRILPKHDRDRYEYSEYVGIDFSAPVDAATFKDRVRIEPETPFAVYGLDYGKRMRLQMRKVPGTTYRVTVSDGGTPQRTFEIETPPAPAMPRPLRSTRGEPYRYGVLEHPFKFSLGGELADKKIDLLARAGVRFVRIDYCGGQIWGNAKVRPAALTANFGIEDAILNKLAAKGITELPIIDQYCAPRWAVEGKGGSSVYSDPADFAALAGAVAEHLRAFPQVTRVEIFNEPNLHGWWSYPTRGAEFDDRSGRATAVYMKAAYAAVKRANPRLTVVGPALSDGGRHTDARGFLAAMYDAGCKTGVCWDVLSVHNYAWRNPTFPWTKGAEDRFDIYKDLQAVAADHGDRGVHVMLTEWGYSHVEKPEGFDPAVQAEYIALGFNLMLADPTVDGIVYVNLYNGGKPTDFWAQTQLVDDELRPLPGFDVLRTFAAE